MADIYQHTNYTGSYSGLVDNLWVTVGIAGICLIGYEIEVHIPRRRGRDGRFKRIYLRLFEASTRWQRGRRKEKDNEEAGITLQDLARLGAKQAAKLGTNDQLVAKQLGSRENWEFGYIYQPRAWKINPCPPVPKWPLAWIISGLKIRERDMPETCGLDVTLHARFIRGCFFYTLLQACIILPILMPIHILHAPADVNRTSMTRASISSLVASSGSHWLWIHSVLIWWITICWLSTVLWITWGALAYRRREIRKLAARVAADKAQEKVITQGEDGQVQAWRGSEWDGVKRYRTLMVTNVPPDMRDEETLREYFDYYIRRHRAKYLGGPAPPVPLVGEKQIFPASSEPGPFSPRNLFRKPQQPLPKDEPLNPAAPLDEKSVAQTPRVQIHDEDNETIDEREWESEVDKVILVRKVAAVTSLRERRQKVLRQLEVAHVKLAQRVLKAVAGHRKKRPSPPSSPDVETGTIRHIPSATSGQPEMSKNDRMALLVKALGPYVDDTAIERGEGASVWDALHSLPRESLDPWQKLMHLKVTSRLRKDNAPQIDFLTTKLLYLTGLLDEARAKALEDYGSSSAAFVTFRDARTARLAAKILPVHPKRSIACNAAPAPEWGEILWPRLEKSVYKSSFVRGWVVFLAVWAFTLAWIFPVSVMCGLASFTSIAGFIPAAARFLRDHPKIAGLISSLAPVILVALLTISICPILLLIANKAETINTRLGVHNSVLERFWKFLMVNGVVFFAIGQAAIETYLTAFQTRDFDPLPIVASSFPQAAPYFASYILLQVAIQPFFEIFRFGLPTIIYVFGTRVSKVPRQRLGRTEYPTFSHFSQLPYQLLIGAIMHLFMLLNPLVIPFTLVYYACVYVVWKRQFTYVYGRMYENNGRRSSIRILRYSLDALALGQFALFAFFILNKAKGEAISTGVLFGITLIIKLITSRALKRRFANLEIEEAEILCPPQPREQDPSRGASSFDSAIVDEEGKDTAPVDPSSAKHWKVSISAWLDKWVYATHSLQHQPRDNPAYRRPIPFDHLVFAWLDRHLVFEDEKTEAQPLADDIARGEPTIFKSVSEHTLVEGHPPLRPWEDIAPIDRMRSYADQPGYTDGYDDFLWLPRDPLSTLDLDDTVEMRLSLTTSQGGDGRFGEWPPEEPEDMAEQITDAIDISGLPPSPRLTGDTPQTVETRSSGERSGTPTSESGHHLFAPPNSDVVIGSEVDNPLVGQAVRRTSLRAVANLARVFGRERLASSATHASLHSLSDIESDSEEEQPRTVPGAASGPQQDVTVAASGEPTQILPLRRTSTPASMSTALPSAASFVPITTTSSSPHVRIDSGPSRTAPLPSIATLASQHAGPSNSYQSPARARARSRVDSRASSSRLSVGAPATTPRSPVGGSTLKQRVRDVSRMSAVQRAMLEEIVAEERKARKDDKKEEHVNREREREEVRREQASSIASDTGLTREKSRRSSTAISPDPDRRPTAPRRSSKASSQAPGSPSPVGAPNAPFFAPPVDSPGVLDTAEPSITPNQPAKSAPKTEPGGTLGSTGRSGVSGDVSSMIFQ